MPSGTRLSLADLLNGAVAIGVQDASALVRRLCECAVPPAVATLESTTARVDPEHVWLDRNGSVALSPGVLPTVSDLGVLLKDLLTEIRSRGSVRIPPGLVLLAARATGEIDTAALPSTAALAAALARFDPPDPEAALRGLFEAGAAARDFEPATTVPFTDIVPPPVAVDAPDVADYEYQAPLAVSHGERAPRRTRPSRGRRRVAAVVCGGIGLAAGMGAAIAVYTPDAPVSRTTDATDVIVTAPETKRQPSRPTVPPVASGRTEVRTPSSGAARVDRRAPARGNAPRADPPELAAPAGPPLRTPERLIDPGTIEAEAAFSPSFAANGSAVFFHAETAKGSALKRADRGESGVLHVVTIVDDVAKNYHVQLSPDGKSVAFDSDRDGVRGVYVAATNGSDVRRVSGDGYAAVPTWSPDGRRLAFLRAENDRPKVWNLWVTELRSGATTRVTNHLYGQVWSGAWFPDGRRIAYSHEDHLILLDLASGQSTSYVSPKKGHLVRTPAVSPDGRWIMFQVFRDGGWLLDLENGSMERVLDDASAEEFTWAPDGRRVAFHSRRSGEWGLWMMAAR